MIVLPNTSEEIFACIALGLVCLTLVVLIFAIRQERQSSQAARNWPIRHATIVEIRIVAADPSDFEYKVEYKFAKQLYFCWSENFLHAYDESELKIGHEVLVKVNPKYPTNCVLYQNRYQNRSLER